MRNPSQDVGHRTNVQGWNLAWSIFTQHWNSFVMNNAFRRQFDWIKSVMGLSLSEVVADSAKKNREHVRRIDLSSVPDHLRAFSNSHQLAVKGRLAQLQGSPFRPNRWESAGPLTKRLLKLIQLTSFQWLQAVCQSTPAAAQPQ